VWVPRGHKELLELLKEQTIDPFEVQINYKLKRVRERSALGTEFKGLFSLA